MWSLVGFWFCCVYGVSFYFYFFVVGGVVVIIVWGVCGGCYNRVLFIYMCLPSPIGYIYYNKVITYYFIMGLAFVVVPVCYS